MFLDIGRVYIAKVIHHNNSLSTFNKAFEIRFRVFFFRVACISSWHAASHHLVSSSSVQRRPQRARRHHLHQRPADRHGERRQRRHQEGGQLEHSGSPGERGRDPHRRPHGDWPLTSRHGALELPLSRRHPAGPCFQRRRRRKRKVGLWATPPKLTSWPKGRRRQTSRKNKDFKERDFAGALKPARASNVFFTCSHWCFDRFYYCVVTNITSQYFVFFLWYFFNTDFLILGYFF